MEQKINIVVPFYNCEKYIEICLNSILTQKYSNFHVYIVNDASTDNSEHIVKNIIKDNDRVTYIVNEHNKTALENIIFVLNNYLEENAIYCIVDGDDFLLSNKANQHISDIFNFGVGGENKIVFDEELESYSKHIRKTNKVLFSYGSASWSNGNKCFSRPYSKEQFNMIKKHQFQISHLRCFLGIVWKEMISQYPDLSFARDKSGEFYKSGYDTILCIPMLQICGYEHTFHNSKPIYYYRLHENNDHVKDQNLQWYVHNEALNKPSFKRIESYE